MSQVPLAQPPSSGNGGFDRWVFLLWKRVSSAGQILWSHLDFGGSNLTDLETRNHNDLQTIQGGTTDEYYHLTSAEYTGTGTGVFVRKQSPTILGQTVDYIDFDQAAVVAGQKARLTWNATDGTLDLGMGFDDVTQQIGLETYFRVKNQTGAPVLNGRAVQAVGTVGNSGQILVDYAIADNSSLSRYVLGVLTMDIANGEDGYVTEFGLVRGIDTTGATFGETWNDGDVLYVSPTTAGYLTKVEPTAPDQKIVMAIVIHAHMTGSIFVRPTHGAKLDELHNVSNAAPDNQDALVWNSGTGVWEPTRLTGDMVDMPYLQASALRTGDDWFNIYTAGQISGGVISATGTQIEVTAGTGIVKSGATPDDPSFFCEWSALPLTTITDQRVTWICVDYNGGSPTLVLNETTSATEPPSLNYNSCFPLGSAVRDGSVVHVSNNPRRIQDAIGGLIRRFHQTLPMARDELVGGILISETGTRNISLSAGYLFDRQNRFEVSALDTSVSDTFDIYYRDGGSGFTDVLGATQWPNTQYDDGSGTLVTMTVNRYANLYWYVETDGQLVMLYGRNQYSTAAAAAEESAPNTLPLRLQTHGRLIARTTFQQSAGTFTAIDSAFTRTFSTTAVSTHNNLSGLQGGTTAEYYHLTAANHTDLTDGGDSTLHAHFGNLSNILAFAAAQG